MIKVIIRSLLDTDLYKFTMQQVVFHRFPDVNVEFAFKLRNYDKSTLVPYEEEINKEIDHLCKLKFKPSELNYMKLWPFIGDNYVELLRCFQLNREYIDVNVENGELNIPIKGPWLNTILFEVPVLAIVSEVYFIHQDREKCSIEGSMRLQDKIKIMKGTGVKFADFGTRRRFSKDWHGHVLYTLINELPDNFVGTSNVYFAKEFGVKPIGTMAHEFIQAAQALVRLKDSQKFAFENWVQEYRGQLGIALSDTLGMDAFLRDFDLYYAKLFDGARHDSGDPYEWCNKLIDHYQDMGIDPKTKTAVFSDGLDFKKAIHLHNEFKEWIKTSFGIGTNITNDLGMEALQIVIKMVKCQGQPVAKISDSPGKQMCNDDEYLKYLSSVFDIKRKVVE